MDVLKRELNPEQLEIARDLVGNVLVIAGPGSGKTRLLVHRIGYQFRCAPNEPFKAVCLTFTTEAAKELNSRLTPIVPASTRRRLWCGNFHQYGQLLLSSYGHLIGFPRDFEVIDENDAADVLQRVLDILSIKRVNSLNLARSISKFRGRVNRPTDDELADVGGRFDEILRTYAQMKVANKVADFDDLIELPIKLLRETLPLKEMVRDVYRFIYVDELQDTSLLQLELLKEIYRSASSSVFGVADEDQILYEWRDARLSTISEFQDAFGAEPKFLVLNHRSPEQIVSVGNALIRHNQGRYDKELRSAVTDRQGVVCLHLASDPLGEAGFIADRVAVAVGSDERKCQDIAILARAGFILGPVKDALRSQHIPLVHIGDPHIAASPATKLLKGAFALAGGYPNAMARIEKAAKALNTALESEAIRPDQIAEIVEAARQMPGHRFMDVLVSSIDLKNLLDGTAYADHLTIASKVISEALRSSSDGYQGLGRLLILEWNRLESQALRGESCVKLMTIHQSKGLEFPVVYIMRLNEQMLPYVRSGSSVNIEEERRLLFVAITRAQDEIVLTVCEKNDRGWSSQPSPFLDDIAGCEISEI